MKSTNQIKDVSDRLNDRIEQIGYTNPAFEFDPKSTFEIRNGCRIMYDMCEKDTYESVKVSFAELTLNKIIKGARTGNSIIRRIAGRII